MGRVVLIIFFIGAVVFIGGLFITFITNESNIIKSLINNLHNKKYRGFSKEEYNALSGAIKFRLKKNKGLYTGSLIEVREEIDRDTGATSYAIYYSDKDNVYHKYTCYEDSYFNFRSCLYIKDKFFHEEQAKLEAEKLYTMIKPSTTVRVFKLTE